MSVSSTEELTLAEPERELKGVGLEHCSAEAERASEGLGEEVRDGGKVELALSHWVLERAAVAVGGKDTVCSVEGDCRAVALAL